MTHSSRSGGNALEGRCWAADLPTLLLRRFFAPPLFAAERVDGRSASTSPLLTLRACDFPGAEVGRAALLGFDSEAGGGPGVGTLDVLMPKNERRICDGGVCGAIAGAGDCLSALAEVDRRGGVWIVAGAAGLTAASRRGVAGAAPGGSELRAVGYERCSSRLLGERPGGAGSHCCCLGGGSGAPGPSLLRPSGRAA